MKSRTIHPAEFAGWRPNMRDAAMATTLLWCSTDTNGEPLERNHDHSALWAEDRKRLQDEWYSWDEAATDAMVEMGCGHLSIDGLLGDRAEHLYVLVRESHGVSMTDDWHPSTKEYKCAAHLERLAKKQGPISPMVGDDGRIYLSFC